MMDQNTKQGGWTKEDRTVRCINCGWPDKTGHMVGTPISQITVSVISTQEPFIPIAKASICRRCNRFYAVRLLEGAGELNISLAAVEDCLKASKNADSFKINELQAGKLDEVELSDSLKALIAARPPRLPGQFNQRTGVYNPNAYLEPAEQGLPL